MIPFITATQVRAALLFDVLVKALRDAFAQSLAAPPRHVHQTAAPATGGPTTLLVMPAWQPGAYLGVKLVTVAAGNAALGLPSVHSIYLLFDATTGVPLAMLDGEELTQRRTAAASALASTYLSRSDADTLLIVGTGRLAPYMMEAHCSVRPIRRVMIWGRSLERARALVDTLKELPAMAAVDIESTGDLPSAARAAHIISCATTSTVPILQGDWIAPGCHVDLVGGFRPDMREADDALMARASVFVDTFGGALPEAGDLVQPLANGMLDRSAILAELADLACGRHRGRINGEEITVFKSVGTAIEDLCAAQLVWAGV